MKQTRLDLGGTACYEDPYAVGIADDGSTADDEVTPHIIGDYNNMPFADNTFDGALGSCYLEERPNWHELYRVMKPGAYVKVKACDAGYAPIDEMEKDMRDAGFTIIEQGGLIDETQSSGVSLTRDDFETDADFEAYKKESMYFDNPYIICKE